MGIVEYTWAITLVLGTPCGLAFCADRSRTRVEHGSAVGACRVPTWAWFCHCLRHRFWTGALSRSEPTVMGIRVQSAGLFASFSLDS